MSCRKSFFIGFLVLALTASLLPAQGKGECFVIKGDNTRIKGQKLTSDDQGNLTLDVDGKIQQNFKRGQYKYGCIPKPQAVAELEKLFEAKKYAEVTAKAPAEFAKYKYLGWSYTIAALEAEAWLAQGNVEKANKAYMEGARIAGENRDRLEETSMRIFIARKEYDKVENLLKKKMLNADNQQAARAFNLRGDIALAKGDKKQAVLEYLKTLMLFEGKKVANERAEAKEKATKLLRELKDPRVDKISGYEM
ncbi:MAG: hypothetical protein J6866_00700 [Victivallales bacterium]|nr:hypothetical protein [Victivallales bacterium]